MHLSPSRCRQMADSFGSIPIRKHCRRGYVGTTLVMGLTVAIMWFFLRSADLASMWSHIGRARRDLIVAAFSAVAASSVMRVRWWQSLLVPIAQVEFAEAARSTVIGVSDPEAQRSMASRVEPLRRSCHGPTRQGGRR